MNAEKMTIYLILIAIFVLMVIKIYVLIDIATLSNDYYILQQEKIELQKENMKLADEYLSAAALINLYNKARSMGFVPATYYLLK